MADDEAPSPESRNVIFYLRAGRERERERDGWIGALGGWGDLGRGCDGKGKKRRCGLPGVTAIKAIGGFTPRGGRAGVVCAAFSWGGRKKGRACLPSNFQRTIGVGGRRCRVVGGGWWLLCLRRRPHHRAFTAAAALHKRPRSIRVPSAFPPFSNSWPGYGEATKGREGGNGGGRDRVRSTNQMNNNTATTIHPHGKASNSARERAESEEKEREKEVGCALSHHPR